MTVGKIVGNYKISQEIGHGGMGKVFKAIHLSLERVVAIKMIHPKLISNNEIISRFYSEAKIQAKLNHPNIVTIYDFFEFEDNHFIIMEYVEGESISKIISHQGNFDVDFATSIFLKILEGINYAHKNNVIHKDIKTSNFILTSNSVKITDFGIAQIIGETSQTEDTGVIGTPKYMSPEMILGKNVDSRTDIYSLGITFYEFLTGKVPFTSRKSDFELRKAQIESPPQPPTEINPLIPKKLEKAILKSLEKNPNDRFQSVEEFITSINDGVNSEFTKPTYRKDSGEYVKSKRDVNKLAKSPRGQNVASEVYDYDESGRLESTNFAKLLSKYHHKKSFGHLYIDSDIKIKSYFYNGYIQFVESDDPNLLLGKLLVDNETITMEDQQNALEHITKSGLKIGEALIKLGKITPHELSSILELQLKLKLINGFRCEEGFYGFKNADYTEVDAIFRIDPIQVIYEAVSKHYVFDHDSEEGIDLDGKIKPKVELSKKISELNLNSIKEIKLFNIIDQEKSINEIVSRSPLAKKETFKFLKFLDLAGFISIEKNYIPLNLDKTQKTLVIDPLGDNTVLLTESIIEEQISEALKKI